MIVSDAMTSDVITAREYDSIVDVARLLSQNRVHAVPVVDEHGRLLGIIAESDFFTKSGDGIYLPSYIEFLQKLRFPDIVGGEERQEVQTLLRAKVEDIMTKDCISVAPEDDMSTLLKIVRTTGFYSIPVVDDTRRVVGIVTMRDAIQSLYPENREILE